MSDLSVTQLVVLRAADTTPRTREYIAERATEQSGWSGSLEGLGITLASLVRRGLLTRSRSGGKVRWELTYKGDVTRRSYREAKP